MAQGILVRFDGSRKSEHALAQAVSAARASETALTVLVLSEVEQPSRCCNLQTTSWNRELRRMAQADAERARALLPEDLEAEVVIREDHGPGAIQRAADDLACRTLPRTGRRGLRRRAFGA